MFTLFCYKHLRTVSRGADGLNSVTVFFPFPNIDANQTSIYNWAGQISFFPYFLDPEFI